MFRNIRKLLVPGLVLGLLTAVGSTPASALIIGFGGLTNNNATNVAIGQNQLFVDITDPGGGRVSFRFFNTGPLGSSITDVYFADGTLLGIAQIINGTGVSFSQGASPPNLPGGNLASPPFQTTAGFLADSNPPVAANGVNPGEQMTIIFNLINGKTFANTLAALNLGGAPGGLRIGIHVQAFVGGGSESFINRSPPTNVPEPASLLMFGIGMLGLGFLSYRRRIAN